MNLTLRDNASMSFTGITNIGNARELPSAIVTIQDSASYSTGTTFDLLQTTALFANSTINLNGGTLTVGSFLKTSVGLDQTATINFNGGTLRPSASSAAFLPALTGLAAQVQNGGANIDTNGFDATIAAALVGVGSGGLTKNGAGTLTLTGANTYTGGTTVNAGTLQVLKMHAGNAVTVNAGTLRVLESAPNYSSGFPSGDNAFVSQPSALTVAAGATVDITNNDIIIDYSGASPIAAYEALVASAYNIVGDWAGPGITSSIAAIDGAYAVAIADNAALPAPFGTAQGGGLFSGVDVDLDTILIKFTHRADVDLDGAITPNDASIFGTNYSENDPATWAMGDMDYDGIFTPNDASIFGTFYDESLASLPEPGSLGLLFVCAAGLARRRQRRQSV
jgi:autotransporter-associated beta strand protein